MVEKYKLLKKYPGSPRNLETVIKFDRLSGFFLINIENSFQIEQEFVENYPEFWAPYLFTTEDGVDIFKGEKCWFIHFRGKTVSEDSYDKWQGNGSGKYFSTKEAAEEYIKSQQTIEVEDGEVNVGDPIYGVCPKGNWGISNTKAIFNQDKQSWGIWIFFKSKTNRDKYIEDNKPQFSREDMIIFHLQNSTSLYNETKQSLAKWIKKNK